jgi:hypothetical protein
MTSPNPEQVNPDDYYAGVSTRFEELGENLRIARLTNNKSLERETEEQIYALTFEAREFTCRVIARLQTLAKAETNPATQKNYKVIIRHYESIANTQAKNMNALVESQEE